MDISSPPSQVMLEGLARYCTSSADLYKIVDLSSDRDSFNEWVASSSPTLLHLLTKEFPSLKPPVSLLFEYLPALKPRMYSISSHPGSHEGSDCVELTVGIVTYPCLSEPGTFRRGVCSHSLTREKTVHCYLSPAPGFHLPQPKGPSSSPSAVILIAAGTGIAPMRGFW